MRPFLASIKNVTKSPPSDLDVFVGAPSTKKLDDKAAILETELASLKSRQAKERSIFVFIISVLVCILIGQSSSGGVFTFAVIACVILNIVFSRTLGAPMLADYLEPWNSRLQKLFDEKFLGKSEEEFE